MREVGVLEAKTHFSALLAEVEGGGEVVITRHGRPVARVVRFTSQPRRRTLDAEQLIALSQAFRQRLIDEGYDTTLQSWEELKPSAES